MPSPTQIWGAAREAEAEECLIRAGYRIVERNWRGGGSEIDRIAWHGDVLCFVEVRARSSAAFGSPAETVGYGKRLRLTRAAAVYLAGLPKIPAARFDVVSIIEHPAGRDPEVLIIPNAFEPAGGCLVV